jgi:hypothetical protein
LRFIKSHCGKRLCHLIIETPKGRGKISHRKKLQARHEVEETAELISTYFGISLGEMVGGKGDRWTLLIHLLKTQTSLTNKKNGIFVGGLSYSGGGQG